MDNETAAAETLPECVVDPGEIDAAKVSGTPGALPAIPEDVVLDALGDDALATLARAYGLAVEDRAADIAALKAIRDNAAAEGPIVAVTNPDPKDWSPSNPGEFGPTVVQCHLERDGVIVQGFINPYSGEGIHDLLVKLQDQLVKARAKEDGAAPAPVVVGDAPDPNGLRRQRAEANGHVLTPGTGHCERCGIAEWAAFDGHPCEPRADQVVEANKVIPDGETESESP